MQVLATALVFVGGAIGTLLRFWWSGLVARRFGETFPFGTLVVNHGVDSSRSDFGHSSSSGRSRLGHGLAATAGGRCLRRIKHFLVF